MADFARAPIQQTPTVSPEPGPARDLGDLQDTFGNQWVLQQLNNGPTTASAPPVAAAPAPPASPAGPVRPTSADTAWIANLPSYARDQIDGRFSEVPIRRKIDKSAKKRRRKGQVVDVDAEVEAEMTRQKANAASIKNKRESTHGTTVYSDVDKRKGTQIAREDFVAVGWSLFGSTAATQAWYTQMKKTSLAGGVVLHKTAHDRLQAANQQLKTERGWEVPTSHVGFQGRHRQHSRNSVGFLAHFLGLAFDMAARANPHLKNSDQRVLVETAGMDGDDPGHARLKLRKPGTEDLYGYGDLRRQIAAMGKATAAGRPQSAEATRLLTTELDRGYDQWLKTEQRMQGSLDVDGNGQGDEVAELQQVAKLYWAQRKELVALRAQFDRATRALKSAETATRRQIRRQSRADYRAAFKAKKAELKQAAKDEAKANGTRPSRVRDADVQADPQIAILLGRSKAKAADVAPDEIDEHPTYAAAVQKHQLAWDALQVVEWPIVRAKNRILAPWFANHDRRIASHDGQAAGVEASDLKNLDRRLNRLAHAGSKKSRARALQTIQADPSLGNALAGLDASSRDDPKAVLRALRSHRSTVQARLGHAESAQAVRGSRAKLDNLDYVFGSKPVGPTSEKVSNPSALQLARNGILFQGDEGSHDSHYKGGTDAGDRDMYYREVTRVLMAHGFAPGGQWNSADSMHFELVEGLAAIGGTSHGVDGRM